MRCLCKVSSVFCAMDWVEEEVKREEKSFAR